MELLNNQSANNKADLSFMFDFFHDAMAQTDQVKELMSKLLKKWMYIDCISMLFYTLYKDNKLMFTYPDNTFFTYA